MASSVFEKQLKDIFNSEKITLTYEYHEWNLIVSDDLLIETLETLKSHQSLQFDTLIDLCGVDYGAFGLEEWETAEATCHGFSRGREEQDLQAIKPKLAVVYHLLSTKLNQRIRVKVFCPDTHIIPSAIEIWPAANWFEREAYDMYGILFENHPDLRRILTDYGFIGHPFRKDFPISGHVEMRYDAKTKRCVYGPVEIEPRILVPKVVRQDNRYQTSDGEA